jgi:DNA-binding CsgD family transcriptional regulator
LRKRPERRSGADDRRSSAVRLTPRESEVLALVLRGLENKQIGAVLGLAEQSVKAHVSALFDKFVVPNRAALADAGAQLEFTGELGLDRAWIRQLFREAELSIAIISGPEFRYEAVNATFRRTSGGRPLVGRTMREAFPELEGDGAFEEVENVYRTGEPWIAHEAPRTWDRGTGVLEQRLIDLSIQPLRGDDGVVNGVITFGLDVTDLARERRQGELLNAELATVLDLVPSGVIVVDEAGYIVKVNDAARRIARVPLDLTRTMDEQAEDVFGSRSAGGRVLAPEDMPFGRALRGIATENVPFHFSAGDPPVDVWVRTSVRPLHDVAGKIRGAVAVFTELDGPPV